MTFAAPWFLLGCGGAALLALLLVVAGLRASRARTVFGDAPRIAALVTHEAATRRAWKGVLLVLAAALAFFAAARPQYGKGTRLVPATEVDVMIVLDLSKSMYARDVEPSRVFRAKAELTRLVKELPGVRFGAVAFAGEPMAFPITADGTAVAQFLRQLEPNDMPVGGTAIARALDLSRDLMSRDPLSQKHRRIVVLVTDGEDLEGSPVSVAKAMGAEGTTVHVVQIGGRTAERIPEVGPDGSVLGWRRGEDGRFLTTELTPEGEAQLAAIAASTPGGVLIRAEKGRTGIEEITDKLKSQRTSEHAERIETVYADVYHVPLALALLLLLVEALIFEAPTRRREQDAPPPPAPHRIGRAEGPEPLSPWVASPAVASPASPATPAAADSSSVTPPPEPSGGARA